MGKDSSRVGKTLAWDEKNQCFVDINVNNIPQTPAERHEQGLTYLTAPGGYELIAHTGRIKAHHFAFATSHDTDKWFENPMTAWHRGWQMEFAPFSQIEYQWNGGEHRSDAYVDGCKLCVEFQYSDMDMETFEQRNAYYTHDGKSLLWVFDARNKFESHFPDANVTELASQASKGRPVNERWLWARECVRRKTWHCDAPDRIAIFLDIGDVDGQGLNYLFEILEHASEEQEYKMRVWRKNNLLDAVRNGTLPLVATYPLTLSFADGSSMTCDVRQRSLLSEYISDKKSSIPHYSHEGWDIAHNSKLHKIPVHMPPCAVTVVELIEPLYHLTLSYADGHTKELELRVGEPLLRYVKNESSSTPDYQHIWWYALRDGKQCPITFSSMLLMPAHDITLYERCERLVMIPNVVGMSLEDAKKAIAEIGLETRESRKYDSDFQSGIVIATQPTSGDRVGLVWRGGLRGRVVYCRVQSIGRSRGECGRNFSCFSAFFNRLMERRYREHARHAYDYSLYKGTHLFPIATQQAEHDES